MQLKAKKFNKHKKIQYTKMIIVIRNLVYNLLKSGTMTKLPVIKTINKVLNKYQIKQLINKPLIPGFFFFFFKLK